MLRQLTVRGIDKSLVDALKRRAHEHHRSMEAEHREILREALTPGAKNFWERAEEFRKEVRLPKGVDTTAMVREDRDSR